MKPQDREGRTVLHWAAERLEVGLVRVLIKSRAAMDIQVSVPDTG